MLQPAPCATTIRSACSHRYYDKDSLLQLQQILFYRELDVPLNKIQLIMSQPDFNIKNALAVHRARLHKRLQRLEALLTTIDQTIVNLQGGMQMAAEDYFEGFDHRQYEDEVKHRWGNTAQYDESQKKWASYSQEEKEIIKSEGVRITSAMVSEDPNTSPDDPGVQAAVGEYYAYLNRYFYTCEVGYLRGLADMWAADPRFAINYDRVRPGGAAFLREAVHIYCNENG